VTQFHALTIKDIRRETVECVSIAFDVPPDLTPEYSFIPGQNVTVKLNIDGEEVRRSYSICSSPLDNELRVAVKHLAEGKFSGHANRSLKVGDKVEVLPPSGRFSLKAEAVASANYLAFAAGSGITPVISIIKSTLASLPGANFTLVYGNRTRSTIIFREQLEALKNKYMDRLAIHHILSREETDAPVNHGRIDADKCELLSKYLIDLKGMDHIFLCGPEQMIYTVSGWLEKKGVAQNKIHFELFTVPGEKIRSADTRIKTHADKTSTIKLKLDGNAISYELPFDGRTILDGALMQGADLPFACKGGVCATCRAKLISGEIEMDNNYALEAEELNAGFILTCQSHPRTDFVEIDFDAK
jgi:ring-1,2-phenylacetyl-CoA epoxidase subunit PaaE